MLRISVRLKVNYSEEYQPCLFFQKMCFQIFLKIKSILIRFNMSIPEINSMSFKDI